MNTKLTLKLDSKVIKKAKKYARSQSKSLSKIVEVYFYSLTKKTSQKPKISTLTKELSGIITLPKKFDHKKVYHEHVFKKYS